MSHCHLEQRLEHAVAVCQFQGKFTNPPITNKKEMVYNILNPAP
jgi:hypothetical protein